MLTSDPIYNKPYKPQITIKNTGNTSTFYDYNPWTDVGIVNKPIHLSLSLSENTHGKFVCQIEDGNRTLDRFNINKGARLIVKVGKQSTQMTTVMSGLIREVADSRGSDRKDLYTLSGSSTSIRNNERIIYYVKQAAKLVSDGITIDITDPNMKAVLLLVNAYSEGVSIQPNYGSESSLGIIDTNDTISNSTVNNFIADLAIEFGEIQDAVNVIEEQTSSELIVSSADIVNLRYEITNINGGRGFTIKNKTYRISGQDDDADDTMYLVRKNWKYSDSVYKSDSYANRISGILAAESAPELVNTEGGALGASTTNEWAFKFRPPHSHWLPGDLYIVAQYFNNNLATPQENPKTRFRICTDSSGVPTNIGGVVANIEFDRDAFGSFPNTIPAYSPQTNSNVQQFFDSSNVSIDSFELDTAKDYWLILSDDYNLSNRYTSWKVDNSRFPPINIKTHTSNFSTNANGGSSWIDSLQTPPLYAMPRRRSTCIIMHDPKAIKNLGSGLSTGGTPIESHLPSFPSIIKTREAGYSYMANQLYYMAKPRANYNIPSITAPNIPPMPGDPIVISDTILGFSTLGNKVIFTRCGDYNISWGNLDGSGLTYEAPTLLNINPVGTIPRYK